MPAILSSVTLSTATINSSVSIPSVLNPSSLNHAIEYADLDWLLEDGVETPLSKQFGDVYFSRANGLAEARHVFLQGNDLSQRLSNLQSHQYFCVGETGFGTGLTILALWQLWQKCKPNNHSRLHVVSVEKYPLSIADLIRALAVWPELKQLSTQLIAQYPVALAGCHRLTFAKERFSIDLWLGDAAHCFSQVETNHAINAWFLDGFAPKHNPELWQDSVLAQIIRLSNVGTTFASFSVAGIVKRGLRAHGIHISRPRGFGDKRQMLKGIWPNELEHPQDQKAPKTIETGNNDQTFINSNALLNIAIIGAGIAGLSMAHALSARGYSCYLFDQTAPLAGASGNPRALIAPRLTSLEKFSNNLMNVGGLYTIRYWQQFLDVIEKTEILHIVEQRAEETLQHASEYATDVLSILDAEQTSNKANHDVLLPSICFKNNALLNPLKLAEHVLNNSLVHFIHAEVAELKVAQLKANQQQWQLLGANHDVIQASDIACFDHVIVCGSLSSPVLCPILKPFKPIRGQVSWFKHNSAIFEPLIPVPMNYGGYIAHLPDQHATLLGASFIPDDSHTDIRVDDHLHNLDLLTAVSPTLAQQLPPVSQWQGRASIRAQSPDYLPFIGKVPDMPNVWTLSGLGSKGFSFSPIAAEFICAQLLSEVWPLTQQVAQTINPARFIKKVKPKKPYYQKPDIKQ